MCRSDSCRSYGGDYSLISDTTILSSAGAQCKHIDHVATQMPYALTVALCASVGYILSGITGNGYIGLAGAAISLALAMMIIAITANEENKMDNFYVQKSSQSNG